MHNTLFSPVYFKPFLTFLTFQQYVNWELPDVQVGFRKGRGIRDRIVNICWIIEKESSRKTFTSSSLTMLTPLCGPQQLWKTLKEMGVSDHFTCLLRNLYAGQEATVRTGHGTTDWLKIGKGVWQAVYCHPAYLTYVQITSCKMLSWMNHKLEASCQEKYQ